MDAEDLWELCGVVESDLVDVADDEVLVEAPANVCGSVVTLKTKPAMAGVPASVGELEACSVVEDAERFASAIAGDACRPPDCYLAAHGDKGGVGLHASRDFGKGEIVLVESAAAWVALAPRARHCDGCARSLATMSDSGPQKGVSLVLQLECLAIKCVGEPIHRSST